MSLSSDDAPTGPIAGRPQQTPEPATSRIRAATAPPRRWDRVVELTAVALLVIGLFLPWNLDFGVGIPGSRMELFVVLLVVTLMSVASVAVGVRSDPERSGRLRLALNVPYLLLVLAFIAFDIVETIRFGGSVDVPGGVGPGAWLGLAGALLAARTPVTAPLEGRVDDGPSRAARIIGYASMALAVLSFCFNLYWRVRYALHTNGGATDFGKQNIAVIATAVVYGAVALIAVLAASRWLLRGTRAARLATAALGASALLAGVIVWLLPVGRDIDAFHGIAQNTSTAGVGWEGYLAWAAAAALFLPRVLIGLRDTSATEEDAWRGAARTGLALIAIWCLGSMAMRITDLLVEVTLDYPYSRYDSVVLAAFDLVTAVLAIWLRLNLANARVSPRLVSSLCGLVATLCVSRVVVGVALAPRFAESPSAPAQHPVYGNNLAQQITSTFDVTLCGLALSILAAAIVTGQLRRRRLRRRRHAGAAGARPRARVPVGRTAPPGDDMDSPTTEIPQLAGAPRIFRGDDSATQQIAVHQPRIFRPPQP